MYKEHKIVGFIPARGGSKGIPHKNIIDLCGNPLISYTIKAALESKYLDYVMVSTDDTEIAEVSKAYGAQVPFLRPAELALDTAKTLDAVIHGMNALREMGKEFTDVVLLQPTQPLRNAGDIDAAIEKYFSCGCQPLLSVCEVDDHPLLVRTMEGDKLKQLLNVSSTCRRQDMPKYYKVNGCIYINRIDELNENTSFNDNVIPYLMEKSHSVDIDEMSDLAMAEYYLKNSK